MGGQKRSFDSVHDATTMMFVSNVRWREYQYDCTIACMGVTDQQYFSTWGATLPTVQELNPQTV